MTTWYTNATAEDWVEADEPLNDADDQRDAVRAGIIPADSVYCEHGTFVGGWAGPDYMCHWCEEGIGMAELYQQRLEAADAGDLCQLAKHGGYLPDIAGEYRPLHWRTHCTPVGPCPHWAETFGPAHFERPVDVPDVWARMGMTTNVDVRSDDR